VTRARGDDGSASAWVLALATLLTAATAVTLAVAAVVVAHRRAESAADLSALAAAAVPATQACPRAQWAAQANGADLRTCRIQPDGSVVVCVGVAAGRLPLPPVVAWARAGSPSLR